MSKKIMAALWIQANGTQTEVSPAGETWELKEIQEKIGGDMEIVGRTNLAPSQVMIVNEDGLSLGLEYNARATMMAGQHIVGDVLIVPRKQLR
jgi:hypothetical protein